MVALLAGAGWLAAAPVPKDRPRPRGDKPNSNALLAKHRDQLKLGCSSQWGGWPIEKLFDEKP